MEQEQFNNEKLDEIMRNALVSNNDLIIPPDVSVRAIRQFEKKILLQDLILELVSKVVIVLGSLALLAGVFALLNGSVFISNLISIFSSNWQLITSLLILILATILIDQVVLRFYSAFYNKNRSLDLTY